MSDTLFLAVSYLDRYLSLIPVTRTRLQLVGVTCLLLAAKYEEIYAPQVGQTGRFPWAVIGADDPQRLSCDSKLKHWS